MEIVSDCPPSVCIFTRVSAAVRPHQGRFFVQWMLRAGQSAEDMCSGALPHWASSARPSLRLGDHRGGGGGIKVVRARGLEDRGEAVCPGLDRTTSRELREAGALQKNKPVNISAWGRGSEGVTNPCP